MAVRKLVAYIDSEPQLRPLLARLNDLADLQQIYLDTVPPPLAKLTRVGSLTEGTLTLVADNGAAAAKLRQLTPRLAQQFCLRQREVTQIHIAVQGAAAGVTQRLPARPRELSRAALAEFASLAERLDETSPLCEAVNRLLRARQSSKYRGV